MNRSRSSAAAYLGVAGGALVCVSLFLPWYDFLGENVSAFETYARGDVYLAALGFAGIVVAIVNRTRPFTSFPIAIGLLGGLALGGPLLLRLEAGFGKAANDAIAAGWYVNLLGAALMCMAAVAAFRDAFRDSSRD
jgi:ABC-type uncharacterized transport system permease subunit